MRVPATEVFAAARSFVAEMRARHPDVGPEEMVELAGDEIAAVVGSLDPHTQAMLVLGDAFVEGDGGVAMRFFGCTEEETGDARDLAILDLVVDLIRECGGKALWTEIGAMLQEHFEMIEDALALEFPSLLLATQRAVCFEALTVFENGDLREMLAEALGFKWGVAPATGEYWEVQDEATAHGRACPECAKAFEPEAGEGRADPVRARAFDEAIAAADVFYRAITNPPSEDDLKAMIRAGVRPATTFADLRTPGAPLGRIDGEISKASFIDLFDAMFGPFEGSEIADELEVEARSDDARSEELIEAALDREAYHRFQRIMGLGGAHEPIEGQPSRASEETPEQEAAVILTDFARDLLLQTPNLRAALNRGAGAILKAAKGAGLR